MKNLIFFITAAVGLFTAVAFMSPQTSSPENLLPQDSETILRGLITEAETGEPAIAANVILYQKGKIITGVTTNFDGIYQFNKIAPGKYDIEVSYVGFETQKIIDVPVIVNKVNRVDVELKQGVTLEAVVITSYKAPLIERDNSTQGRVVTSEDIKHIPRKNINALASTAAGISKKDKRMARRERKKMKDDAISVRGSRTDATNYYVDGVQVQGSLTPPPAPATTITKTAEKEEAPVMPASVEIVEDDVELDTKKAVTDKTALTLKDSTSDFSRERYEEIYENPFLTAKQTPLSTFSIDVDAASYSNTRRFIRNGSLPPADAVRIEEMVNYFNYNYPAPKDEHPFEIITEISDCPWQKGHKLLHVGLQGKKIAKENLPASNLVFLLDVSGSMNNANKLPLLKESLSMLVDNLRQEDFVSIVVYAGAAGVVLKPTNGTDKHTIKEALNKLRAGGSTAGGAGIKLAYKLARENFVKDGNNRVILATDGDFNVGISDDDSLVKMIEKERESGVFLTVLGFGMGNYQDAKMQKLADKGNGNHAYIDNLTEAKKVLVNEFGGTIFAIAKDVKLQLEFNSDQVQGYRLIGYENRLLADEDFDDDTKDAGELGAGHTVTALYEIIPVDHQSPYLTYTDEASMQNLEIKPFSGKSNEMVHIKFRYKAPDGKKSKLIKKGAVDNNISWNASSENFRWSAAVAEFGLLLRDSKYKGASSWKHLEKIANNAKGKDLNGYRKEMLELIEDATILSGSDVSAK